MSKTCETRDKLVQAAAELIWRDSYHATGVDAICKAAGVQKGCFYHHFESKEVLSLAAVDMIWAQYKRFMDESFSPANEPVDRFVRFLDGGLQGQLSAQQSYGIVRGCPLFGLGSEVSTQEPNIRRRVDEILGIMMKYFASAIREGQAQGVIAAGDPERLAAMVLSLSEGALTLARIQNDVTPLQHLTDGVLRLLGAQRPGTRQVA